jgi:hypothetical protein
MPLQMLWLSHTQVSDLSPLAGSPIVSITLEGTPVKDVAWASTMPSLQRLHIAQTAVTDLSPLKDLPLTRLIFTPARIRTGIMEARRLGAMREIGPTLEAKMDPVGFWQAYDQGAFK